MDTDKYFEEIFNKTISREIEDGASKKLIKELTENKEVLLDYMIDLISEDLLAWYEKKNYENL